MIHVERMLSAKPPGTDQFVDVQMVGLEILTPSVSNVGFATK